MYRILVAGPGGVHPKVGFDLNQAVIDFLTSDRVECFSSLDPKDLEACDGMVIVGKPQLIGGKVDSYNDHRIAMSAAIASLVCRESVAISRFEAINKSYPAFAENFVK